MVILAERLYLPAGARAVLWDMDGVLLDSLGFDVAVCNDLLQQKLGERVYLKREFIRSIFAYHPPEFWKRILEHIAQEFGIPEATEYAREFLEIYNQKRNKAIFSPHAGIREILQAVLESGLPQAVVSNNPTADIQTMLAVSGLIGFFNDIVGNDIAGIQNKPSPEPYLLAARKIGFSPKDCVVVEDSLLGAEAGSRAGCFTIGVATGGADLEVLDSSSFTATVYKSFKRTHIELERGHVTKKRIETPNEFVSHMIEHIAWRMGVRIDLEWHNTDWRALGEALGRGLGDLGFAARRGAAMGMIDDGSAEVMIDLDTAPGAEIEGISTLDLDWFVGCRCEQLSSGRPLLHLIEGLARGIDGKISVVVWGVEDPHHTWEGVFRSLGIALKRMSPERKADPALLSRSPEPCLDEGAIRVEERSFMKARVVRETAESIVSVEADFEDRGASIEIRVPPTIRMTKLGDLLRSFAAAAGLKLRVRFDTTVLGSSHVVAEDTGLVLGRALKEILVIRMQHCGANGAGSSVVSPADLESQPIRVGVSVEGRKCWKLIPADQTFDELRKSFIIGHTVSGELFSEDLDDFIDGLSGGLSCSVMIHFKEIPDPQVGWPMIFENMGKAVRETFEVNTSRKGVPPGVKATLS